MLIIHYLFHVARWLYLQAVETVTTSAQAVEVARSPMLDHLELDELRSVTIPPLLPSMFLIRVGLHKTIYDTFEPGHRDPASPTTLAATAAELQGSARIATKLSTANNLYTWYIMNTVIF